METRKASSHASRRIDPEGERLRLRNDVAKALAIKIAAIIVLALLLTGPTRRTRIDPAAIFAPPHPTGVTGAGRLLRRDNAVGGGPGETASDSRIGRS